MKTIKLPIFDIEIVHDSGLVGNGSGTITSNLHADDEACYYNAMVDTLEALILAHACAGVDVSSKSYLNGIQTVVDKILNDLA